MPKNLDDVNKLFKKGHWGRLNFRLLRHFNPYEVLILTCLLNQYRQNLQYKKINPDNSFFFSFGELAHQLSMSRVTVKKYLPGIVDRGFAQYINREHPGRGNKTLWFIHTEKIQSLLYPSKPQASKPQAPRSMNDRQRMVDAFAKFYKKPIPADKQEVVNRFIFKLYKLWEIIPKNHTKTTAPGNFGPTQAVESIFEIDVRFFEIATLSQKWFFEAIEQKWVNDGYLDSKNED